MEAEQFLQTLGFKGGSFNALVDHPEVGDSHCRFFYNVSEFIMICFGLVVFLRFMGKMRVMVSKAQTLVVLMLN
jgi:hypothetical protein